MRMIGRLLAPLIFWIAYALFRSPFARGSKARHDYVMKLFRYAADHQSRRALSVYGHLLHFRGEGVSNRIQGAIYLQQAADLGDMKAQYQMGRIFDSGFEGYFRVDAQKARHYYSLAARQGHSLAQTRCQEYESVND
ncbi:tetratricopeptide repeat protein [Nitrincola iocasae]|uniref:Sel1 repeat family protein n=1 Tax=Nitrincola iocasae TaxID=2614693 RepID=A0A5J6LGB4_9GAMM|nr:SEL1-like repeat protein [Nitrincola iocasae]QEW07423.1 sel1 repeat family protein [Nitrincola iocasae]